MSLLFFLKHKPTVTDDEKSMQSLDGLTGKEIYEQLKKASIEDRQLFVQFIRDQPVMIGSCTLPYWACYKGDTHVVELLLEWDFIHEFKWRDRMVCLFAFYVIKTLLIPPALCWHFVPRLQF